MACKDLSASRRFLKTPTESQYGCHGYFGLMFDVVSAGKATIHAVHTVTFSSYYNADSTVFTVMGGFAANKDSPQSWTQQCNGAVGETPSRLQLSAPVTLKNGDRLGIYIAALKNYGTGVANARPQLVCDDVLTISHGVILTAASQFQGFHSGSFDFVGWVEYAPGIDLSKSALVDLSQDLDRYCLCDDMADVTLIVGSARLPAHGLLLAARSSVFRAMFKHPMREQQTREVIIEGLEEATVTAMLRFIYSGKLDPSVLAEDGPCMSLLRAAHQYDLPLLCEACVAAFAERMQVESVS